VIITRWVRLARTPGGWYRGRKPSNLQKETVRSQSTLYNIIFFRPLPCAPNCAAHEVKWTFGHGRTTSCTRILQYSRYIYIFLSWIFRVVYTNTFGHNECVVGINGTARFIISFALTPNRTHGVPCIIFFQIPYHRLSSADRSLWIWYYFFLLTQILIYSLKYCINNFIRTTNV